MRFLSNLIASTLGALLALGIIVFFFFLFIFAIAVASDGTPAVSSGSVLVIKFAGPIPEVVSRDPLMSAFADEAGYDLRDLRSALRKAAVDERIEGVWLQMQGVSASWATLQEARNALLQFKRSGKFILASSDDYSMDEADYFVASAADSVYAAPQAFFEFNGFFLSTQFYENLLEKLNVEPQIVRAGRFKSAVEPYQREDLSPESEAMLNDLLGTWNRVFMDEVAESRGLKPDALQQLAAEAAIVTARDAERAGLLDALLFRDQVEAILKARLEIEDDDDLRQVRLESYRNVPASEAGLEVGDEGEVAIVYAVGAIMSGKSGFNANPLLGGTVVGAETFNEAMERARENDRVKAVVLRVNSPGGSAAAADVMTREIELTAAAKPLIVSMGDYAASGGYWIAVPADTIVASPLSLTGSIGVFSVFFDASGLFEEKLGITFDGVQTSPYADMFSGVRSLTPAEEALLQRSTQETYDAFLAHVARSRGLEIADVDSVGQGRVWTGLRAKELGLVDVLGDLDTAVDLAAARAGLAAGTYRTRILPEPKTFLERLGESLNARAEAAWLKVHSSPLERALLQQAGQLRRLAELPGTVQARLPVEIDVR